MSDALSIALTGLMNQQQRLDRAAHNIATATVPGADVDIAKEIVDIIEIKSSFKAQTSVVTTQKEMTDSLLDIIA